MRDPDLGGQHHLVAAVAEQPGEDGFAVPVGVAVGGVDAGSAGREEVLDHPAGGLLVDAVTDSHGAQDDRSQEPIDSGQVQGFIG